MGFRITLCSVICIFNDLELVKVIPIQRRLVLMTDHYIYFVLRGNLNQWQDKDRINQFALWLIVVLKHLQMA